MELRQLEYFVSAAELANLTRVAERHFVSQPNISVAIQKLEQELGVQLFERKKKNFCLTAEGRIFLERIRPALLILNNSVAELKDYRKKNSGTIVLGIPPMISSFLFSPLLKHFRTQYPEMELSVVEEGSYGLQDRLATGEIDIGILITNDAPSSLNIIPLMTQQHLVCMSKQHPLAQKMSIEWEDLADEPLIVMKNDSYHRRVIIHECEKRGISTHIFLSSNKIQTNINLVAKGEGISFILEAVDLNKSDVITRRMSEPTYVTIGIAWKKEKYLSYAANTLIEFIEKYIKGHFIK